VAPVRSADDHAARLLNLLRPPTPGIVPLREALGLVLAADVTAAGAIPPFDNSAMDGYAVRAADCAGASPDAPVTLAVVGESAAGHPFSGSVAPGFAVRIMTGAPLPAGADSVVAQEHVTRSGGDVVLGAAVRGGAHVRRAGEDARSGDVVVRAGVELRPRHLAAAASAGVARVEAWPAPRVAFLVTGDELVAPGEPLGLGQIHESNATTLAASLQALGAVPIDLGIVGDSADAVRRAVESAVAAGADLVVTTGGASVGDHDPVKEGLAGAGIEFLNVAMQPGKPQGLGVVGGVPVVSLPGNPVAVAVCVELFVGPAVRALRGVPEPAWETLPAAVGWACPPGREQLMPVVIEDGALRPATSGGSGSHLVARLAVADGIARVPASTEAVAPGDTLAFRRFTA
jgi:molybdopterin molybdotransferase